MNIMLERDEIQSDGKVNVVIKTHLEQQNNHFIFRRNYISWSLISDFCIYPASAVRTALHDCWQRRLITKWCPLQLYGGSGTRSHRRSGLNTEESQVTFRGHLEGTSQLASYMLFAGETETFQQPFLIQSAFRFMTGNLQQLISRLYLTGRHLETSSNKKQLLRTEAKDFPMLIPQFFSMTFPQASTYQHLLIPHHSAFYMSPTL